LIFLLVSFRACEVSSRADVVATLMKFVWSRQSSRHVLPFDPRRVAWNPPPPPMSRVLESNPTRHLGHVGLGPTKSQADHYKLAWRGPATFPSPHVIPPRGRTYPPSRARAEPDSAARHDSDTDSPGKKTQLRRASPYTEAQPHPPSFFLFSPLSCRSLAAQPSSRAGRQGGLLVNRT
jgi:hypothetical protein